MTMEFFEFNQIGETIVKTEFINERVVIEAPSEKFARDFMVLAGATNNNGTLMIQNNKFTMLGPFDGIFDITDLCDEDITGDTTVIPFKGSPRVFKQR